MDPDMNFWSKIHEQGRASYLEFHSLADLRTQNPTVAVLSYRFEDWAGLAGFLLETGTKLASLTCNLDAPCEAFLNAAVLRLDCWTLVSARLGSRELESLRSACVQSSNSPALRLVRCKLIPQFTEFLVSHFERLAIEVGTSCNWPKLGKALQQPSSTLQDLSLHGTQSTLGWLADALQSQHCKLRRLALRATVRIPKQLLQVLQRLEGFEIHTVFGNLPDEGALVEALKASSSLWFFQTTCRNLSHHLLHEGILKAKRISHMVLSPSPQEQGLSELRAAVELIPEFLSSPDCRLQSFIALFPGTWELQPFQEGVLNALEGNYHNQIEELQLGPWKSKSLEDRCSNLLHRNRLSRDSLIGKYMGEFSRPPQVLKLFMCGHPGVGKTTIATNLLRSVPVPAFLQRHVSTQGISLSNLEIGGKNLVIFDLAGQEVYHAFHHYFIRRSENDLFLIVCKLSKEKSEDSEQNRAKLQSLLRYWLRFIVSHQSANAQTKPKVFVVLNQFCNPNKLEYDVLEAVNKVLKRFGTKVNFMEPVLEVVALELKQVSKVKESLKLAADTTAQHLPLVPKICNDLIEGKHKTKAQKQSVALGEKTVLSLEELEPYLPDIGDDVARINTLKFTLMCLHNMGEAVYFGSTEDVSELGNHAILDVPWFVQEVISKFIPKLPRNDDRCGEKAEIRVNSLRADLMKVVRRDQKNPESTITVIVKFLEAMGLIIPHWKASDLVIIQTLLNNKFQGWKEEDGTAYRYWGRRMQPLDTEFTLLPSGVFSIIQADIAALCKSPVWQNQRSLELGDGWISFNKSSVKVLVLVGGENEQWTDRQWVDIMLMVPEDNIRCVEAERILSSMRDCTLRLQQACPVLRIEEHVLNPKQVKSLLLHGGSNTGMQTTLLNHLKHIDGLDFSWDPNSQSSIGELLMLSELKQLLDSRQSVVDDFTSIAPIYELEQSIPAMPEFEHSETRKLAEYLTGILQGHFQQLEVSMQTMLDTLCRVERSLKLNQEHMLSNLSKMLQHIQVPKLPYFTDEQNLFFKYSNLAGRTVWIHFMCESAEHKHPVDHDKYEGVPITVAHEWINKYKSVLVPAITLSFFIAKVGTTAAGIPVQYVLDFAEKRLKATINSCFGQSIDITQPAEHEVEEVVEHVKKAAMEQNLTVLMAKYFGLFFHKGAWVCDKHKL